AFQRGACAGSGDLHENQQSAWPECPPGPPRKRRALRPDLPVAAHAVLERSELLYPYRAARMHPPGSDSDLRSHAEFAAIGELGGSVVQQDRRIDLVEETLDGSMILGDDRLGVVGGIALDMVDRLIDAVDQLRGDDRVQIFGPPILLRRGLRLREGRAYL